MALTSPVTLISSAGFSLPTRSTLRPTDVVTYRTFSSNSVALSGEDQTNTSVNNIPQDGQTGDMLPDPFIDDASLHIIEIALQVGVLPALVFPGLVMNVLNMAVFLRQGLSDRINICLFSLAVSDTGYMLFMMATRFFGVINLVSASLGEYWKARSLSLVGVYAGFQAISNCLTVLISLERSFCILFPLKAKLFLSVRKIVIVIVLITILSMSTNLFFCTKYDIKSYRDPVTNATRYISTLTTFYKRHSHVVDFIFEDVNIVVPAVSFTFVAVATTAIAVRMRSTTAWRKESANMSSGTASAERREALVTQMLVVICVIYVMCTLPYVVHSFFRLVVTEFRPEGRYKNTVYVTTAIMHICLCINCSVNFVVYYRMSTRFRSTFNLMIRKKTVSKNMKSAQDSVTNISMFSV